MSDGTGRDGALPSGSGIAALSILFLARISVSFQFQSVAPLSTLLDERFAISLSGLGLLLGLYMAPGVVVALTLPGLIDRYGRRTVFVAAFVLMAAGEVALWSAPAFGFAAAARLLAGAGGCVIYIVTINMVADLRTIVPATTRMGIIAAAWPFGNAFALGVLGWLVVGNAGLAQHAPLALVLAGLAATTVLLLKAEMRPAVPTPSPSLARWGLVLRRIGPVALSFALYNIGFIILTGFAGRILVEDGLDMSAASGIAGVPMLMFLLSVPLGGMIGGRSVSGDRRIVAFGCLTGAAAVLASAGGSHHALLYAIAGLAGGLPTAPMLARGRAASGEGTDITYSALFFVFFTALIVLPPLAGIAADLAGTAHAVLIVVAVLLACATVLYARALKRGEGPDA